jgi:integrase
MANARVSKRAVDALKCPEGKDRAFLWDDALAGFGVVAFPTGRKVYIIQYRQAGRSRRFNIGEHGRLTPDEARSQAKAVLGAAEKGTDPIEERRAARAVRTFRELADEYIGLHVKPKRGVRTCEEYQRLLDLHVFPAIGAKRVLDIRRAEVTRLHSAMVRKPRAANHCLALISAIWNWAARRDEVQATANPARGIERFPEQGRERYLKPDELARLGEALREAETVGIAWNVDEVKPKAKHAPKAENRRTVVDPFAVAAIRLLILTGARLREILDAKWSQVVLDRGVLFLAQSKTGRKPLYLSAAAQAVLATIPRVEKNPYIIVGSKRVDDANEFGAPRADLKKPWAAVRRAAGLDGVRLHDLRHSFASIGAGSSFGLPIIGKLLGHSQPATTARYAHLDADPVRRAVESIGATIAAAMDVSNGAEIVPINRNSANTPRTRGG